MYIIELIAKILKEKKESSSYNAPQIDQTDYENVCEHTFFPIDSTGETLACSKCGLIIKNSEQSRKPKNPFV